MTEEEFVTKYQEIIAIYPEWKQINITRMKDYNAETQLGYEDMIATETNSSSNYYKDHFWASVGGQIALSGANYNDGFHSGGFAVYLYDVSGDIIRAIGSRVFS